MRRHDDQRQWVHTDEEEALHGFSMTNTVDMPPSLRDSFDGLYAVVSKLETETRALRLEGDRAVELLRRWYASEPKVTSLGNETFEFLHPRAPQEPSK